ncbi:hypothetical protein PINS_up011794 [Pythium insidiosum]|nr:hypothetical protein PINS_up011794 [Pythium insidiosum]
MAMRRNGNRARCQHDGCDKFAQTRGLCKAHGGGSRCRDPSCHKLAQSRGLCIAHGGGRRCQHEGCAKLAQSKGFCISHGGGRRCAVPDCKKFSQVRGRCKSHSKLALDRSEDDVELSSQDDLDADMPSPASSVRSVSPAPSPEQLRRRRVKKENALPATKLSIDFLVNPVARRAEDAADATTSARPALLAVGSAPSSAPHHHLLLLQHASSSSTYLDPSARWQEQHRRPSYPSPPAEFVLKNPSGCLDDDSLRAPPYAFAAGPPPRSLELEEKQVLRFDAPPLSSRFQPPPAGLFGQRPLRSPQLPAPPTSRSLLSFLDGPTAAASDDSTRSLSYDDPRRRPSAHATTVATTRVMSTPSMTTSVVLPSLSHLNMR